MLKKLICLTLCLVLLAPLLVACKDKNAIDSIVEEASKVTRTLNVWLIAEPGMDAEQADKVVEAVNKLTKAKYKTKLNIKFFQEDEYYEAVEAAFAWQDANPIAARIDSNADEENAKNDSYINEFGMVELKYPEVPENEVDILFIGSFEKYSTYVNNKWLAVLDNPMQENQELSYNINPTLLTAARYNKQVYAIPNNHGAGHYTYLLADTELLEQYASFRQGTTLYDTAFKDYLDYIYRTYNDPADKVYPLYSETGVMDLDFAHYWNFTVDAETGAVSAAPETFSIFGDNYLGKTQLGNENLLGNATYMRALATKTYYEHTDGYITTDANARAAVRVVKGSLAEKRDYEEQGYTIIQMEGPTLRNEDVYSSMFAVGARSASVERSMEILTYINTDEEIRNLLQYGIRDVNYTLSTTRIDGLEYPYVSILPGNGYRMDMTKTGNQFIVYPVGIENARRWESEKEQNLELSKYPGLGIWLDQTTYQLDLKNVVLMNAVSAATKTYLDSLTTSAEVIGLHNLALSFAISGEDDDDAVAAKNEGFAAALLALIGPVNYTYDGTVTAVTAENLAEALSVYQSTSPVTNRIQLYGPYQLYLNWCVMSGVTLG